MDAEEQGWDEEAVAIFVSARPRLMAIAYRILASTSEAEDVVQEVWLRWQRTDRSVVLEPQALLVTMAVRLAVNVSQSARRRHETYLAPAVPAATDASDDPASVAERSEAVEHAVRIIMERLTPRERAALVLREAFDYPYGQLAEFLHLGAANTRQLVSRARRRTSTGKSTGKSTGVSAASSQRFLEAFLHAARAGDVTDLEELLAADLAGA
ncbi:sigma-70 family RNA polymerase sigma factor [Kribbella sp. HUAS MG21]|uniref:Sigma-70 family RNA polymerase sigma factor n=1 Tax=Kribbella sp. HUAS MG21 TaxID=3160966 RepID=A0AAU7TEB2_9ACTN